MLPAAQARRPLAPWLMAPVTLLALAAGGARANPFLETLGGVGGANPLTARLMADGGEAAYFAPALLPYVEERFALGFFVMSDPLETRLRARPAGADIGESIYDAWQRDADGDLGPLSFRPLPTALLASRSNEDGGALRSYLTIALAKQLIGKRLALGFLAVLPTSTFQEQTARFADERQQFFSNELEHELYGDRLGMMTVSLGLGGEILPWLSWGAGFVLGLSTTTTNPVYIPDAANQREILITSDTGVDTALAPHVSLAVRPSDNVLLAFSAHARARSETRGTNRLKFWSYDYDEGETALVQRFSFVNGYDPVTFGAGARITFPVDDTTRWQVGTELRWRGWSEYRDRVGERPDDRWADVLTVALGGRYESGSTSVHADIAWVPTPVPDQSGRENYVDSDRLGLSAGLEANFEVLGVDIRGSVGVQLHRLFPRSVVKRDSSPFAVRDEFPDDAENPITGQGFPEAQGLQTNNPGFPGYTSEGWLFGAGVSLKVDL
ncbi:MAG: hypothetical protein IT385_00775 [Deltaproteobacteria bacterium]|nr:hypothetical protein [Deltaproteobacteria bacterium]